MTGTGRREPATLPFGFMSEDQSMEDEGIRHDLTEIGERIARLRGRLGASPDDATAGSELEAMERKLRELRTQLEAGDWEGRKVATYPAHVTE